MTGIFIEHFQQWAGSESINQKISEEVVTVDWFSTTKPRFICCSVPLSQRTMEKNSVLISNAGILIYWKLNESLRCFSDQNLNWFNCWIIVPSFSLRATTLHVFHSWASFASRSELKGSVSKATKLRSQQGTCFSPCEAACVGTHVRATVQKKAECVIECGLCLCTQNCVRTVPALGFKVWWKVKVTCEHTF